MKKNLKQYKNLKLWFALIDMPPLDHWPNRSLRHDSFSFVNSQVIQFIMIHKPTDYLPYAVSLFHQAKKKGCIIFDPSTKLWLGNKDWEP